MLSPRHIAYRHLFAMVDTPAKDKLVETEKKLCNLEIHDAKFIESAEQREQ